MKNILYLLMATAVIAFSCAKEPVAPVDDKPDPPVEKTCMIQKITLDGKLHQEFIYDTTINKVIKVLNYDQGTLNDYVVFDRDASGSMTKGETFDATDKLTKYQTYEYNSNGVVKTLYSYARNFDGSFSEKNKSSLIYNSSGQLTNFDVYEKDGSSYKVSYKIDYEYNTDGNAIRSGIYSYYGGTSTLVIDDYAEFDDKKNYLHGLDINWWRIRDLSGNNQTKETSKDARGDIDYTRNSVYTYNPNSYIQTEERTGDNRNNGTYRYYYICE